MGLLAVYLALGLLPGALASGLSLIPRSAAQGGGAIAGVLIGLVCGWYVVRWLRPQWLTVSDWAAFYVLVGVLSRAAAALLELLLALLPGPWNVPIHVFVGGALLLLYTGGAFLGSSIVGLCGGPWIRGWIHRTTYPNSHTNWGEQTPRLGP